MKYKSRSKLLRELATIATHAHASGDRERCLVAPSPELRETLKKDMVRVRGTLSGPLAKLIRIRDVTAPGFNDGLIYPGALYPVGTPLHVARSAAASRVPLRGTLKIAVVLVDFSDKAMTQTKKHFEDLFFSTGVLSTGSVREYYREVSNNLIDIQGEVVGTYRMPKKLTEYAHGDSGTGAVLPNARTMAYDAAVASNADVNFAGYDNDGDGYVDAFIVIHAGQGAEVTGSVNDIWSHKWVLPSGAYDADTVKVYAYLTVPEDAKIGVCCHELGHLLFGWPDLYDTDYSSEGLGNWCLMAGGSWNGGGDTPAHPSAWCKADQTWVSVAVQTINGAVSIPDVKSSHLVHRLWKDGAAGSEYFLVENRQRSGFDQKLPGDGLLIWHVDETIASNADENHPKVALMQADGKGDLEHGTNRGDAGDPFPGSSSNTTFKSTTTPNSKSYAGANTCVAVTGISASAGVMTATFAVKCAVKLKHEFKEKEILKEHQKEIFKDKELHKEKESKELKDQHKEIKEKEFKELKDQHKEIKEKDFKDHKEAKEFKELEKPVKEKDKDKDVEIPGGWPGGGGLGRMKPQEGPGAGSPEDRLAALEARLAAIEPFIDVTQRPDLRQSALSGEADLQDLHARMLEGAVGSKRLYDTQG